MTYDTAAPEAFDGGSSPHSDPLWDAVRDAYLAGATVASLREDFGMPSSTFYKRAGREGWLHRPRVAPRVEPLDLEAPMVDPSVLLDLAWRRLSHALEQGQSADALRWLRVHDRLKATAAPASACDLAAANPAIPAAPAARPAAPSVEKVETVFQDSTALGPRPPLNRAERRRLARRGGGP
jgi:hypothetical protein